jgi:hypothetical protein
VQTIKEPEFERLVDGILEDRQTIIRHNPVGTSSESLLWMLMSCLISYLNIQESESPCFTGVPNAETYREAIRYILQTRKEPDFDAEPYLDRLTVE